MEIKITRDTMSDIYFDALRIRNEVFVKEQGVPYELEVGNALEEATSVHFVSYDEKKLLEPYVYCFMKIKKSGLVQRMAVLKEEREKHLASQLLKELICFAQKNQVETLILHAQLTARGFYPRFGFVEEGEIFEEAGIKHITMKKTL
ncbi:GNAT family N-acetyltransferase [Lactococcus fujiensis]|uniref:GNAT family N-acetyltransferase n=1 Tax=Lactococcus fujiensis TaxID=610251 RepID=UPI0006D2A16F|nr:GNAT family N-acetyltransferase [Lactococcus fujiensis]